MLFLQVQAQGGGRIQGPLPPNRAGANIERNRDNMSQGEYNQAFRNSAGGRVTDGRVNMISPRNNAGGRGTGGTRRNRSGGRSN